MITDIDQAADVLGADLRSIWRQVADILRRESDLYRRIMGTPSPSAPYPDIF